MKKLIRAIIRWAQKSNYSEMESASDSYVYPASKGSRGTRTIENEQCFNFGVYNANGGKIIQCWHYDQVKDRQSSNLYVIHADDNLAEELSMILTRESLSR